MRLHITDLYTGEQMWPLMSPFPTVEDAIQAMMVNVNTAIMKGESASYAIVDEDERVLRVVTTSCFVVAG